MNMTELGLSLQYLSSRGFKRTAARKPNIRAFKGSLQVSAGPVPVRLEIEDWDFVSYPHIEILEYPAFLPRSMPHIDSSGGLCYLARGSIVLDRFAPASAIALCLEEAEKVLESVVSNRASNQRDMRDEFLAYWGGGANRTWALVGHIERNASTAQFSIVELPKDRLGGARLIVISTSQAEVENLARCMSGNIAANQFSSCWILETDVPPIAPNGNLPVTVSDVFTYLRAWDDSLHKEVQRLLGTDRNYLQQDAARFAIRTPPGWLGFSFELSPAFKKAFARKPQAYRQHLHTKGGTTAISRMTLTEFGTDFIHARNLKSPTLAGKRVHIVGCGAIGGYLAQSLARLGAGSLGGVLKIVDPEILEPDNVGRHWLGMSSLFLPKSQAVVAELSRQFPESKFVSEVMDVRETRGLFDADLIVDATGIEALSEALNASYCGRDRSKTAPILYVWVLGNGEAVQTLWVDSDKFGCYRCLRQPKGSQYRQERFPILTTEPTLVAGGCGEYRPYAVSAPMTAAALATDAIVDWLGGNPSPRLRISCREGAAVRHQKNLNMTPLRDCPACRH